MVDPGRSARIRQKVAPAWTQVAGEQQPRRRIGVDLNLNRRRTQDMAGLPPPRLQARHDLDHLVQMHGLELMHRAMCVLDRVDRLDRRPAAPLVAPVQLVDLALLDVAGVGQHDLTEIAAAGGGVDRAAESRLHQLGQEAGVIDVGVGQEHRVDLSGIEGKRLVVERL